jgi:hypothetical protein
MKHKTVNMQFNQMRRKIGFYPYAYFPNLSISLAPISCGNVQKACTKEKKKNQHFPVAVNLILQANVKMRKTQFAC